MPEERFMALAIEQARLGLGRTHPNPPVGAVIVRNGQVVGKGHHCRAGLWHAEVEALRNAGEVAAGADLYVTLEPCNHYGRTPPCTEAVLKAQIARVFIGTRDPNPASGKGIERLRDHGVEVHVGVLEDECRQLIRAFAKHVTTGLPLVVLKAAATLDGKLATKTGDSKWVTGDVARRLVHVWRDELDAVLIGANTLRIDDPLLTTRLDAPAVEGRQPRTPLRVVLLGERPVSPAARLFDTTAGPVTVFCTATSRTTPRLPDVTVIEVPPGPRGVDPRAVLKALGERGITSVLIEGGAGVHADFLRAGLVDEVRLFLAPRITGGDGLSWVGPLGVESMQRSWGLDGVKVERVGEDLLVTGSPRSPER